MPTLTLTIRNIQHQIACTDADVPRLTALAERFRERIDNLAKVHPRAQDTMLLILAGLTMEDELTTKISQAPISTTTTQESSDEAVASAIDAVADYVEALALKFEKR